jgi:DNA-binding GntR family transcriptional regulator
MTLGPTGGTSVSTVLRAVEVGGVRQEIVDIVREAIWNGSLDPGRRLNESWLAAQLGVSRPPLREAIRVLEQEGLVVSIPRRGAFVSTLTGHDISEIYTIRCALEGMAAELAMEAPPKELDRLDRMIEQVESWDGVSGDRLREVVDRDFEFHRSLIRLSGNVRLASMWDQLAGQLRLALTLVDPAFFRPDYVQATHRPLVAAIRRGDRAEVQRLSRTLLEVGRDLKERWNEPLGSGPGEER